MFSKFVNRKFLTALVTSFMFSYALGTATLSSLMPQKAHASVAPYAYLLESKYRAMEGDKGIIEKVFQVNPFTIKTVDVSDYRALPIPTGEDGNYASYKELITEVANITGTDRILLAKFAAIESSFRRAAIADSTESNAKGLGQFIDDTWKEVVARHGKRYNVTLDAVMDPRANLLMLAMRLQDNYELLERVITDREINETDLYMAHFLGRTGAVRFFQNPQNMIAAKAHPRAAKGNKNIFYSKKGARTNAQMYSFLENRLTYKVSEFNIH